MFSGQGTEQGAFPCAIGSKNNVQRPRFDCEVDILNQYFFTRIHRNTLRFEMTLFAI